MIPYDQYVKLAQADEAGVVQRLNRSLARMAELNAHMTEVEIEADLDKAAKSVPRRRRKS